MSDVRADRWDQVAGWYDESTADNVADPATAALLSLVGPVQGKRVVDVACGQGRIARTLARRGANVVGIDVSAKLLELARAREADQPLGIRYELGDVTAGDVLDNYSFDQATCNYGMSDIDAIRPALATVQRALVSGGQFVFSILHPCFPGWGANRPSSWAPGTGYDTEGYWRAESSGFRGSVGANHRMLSTYLNALVDHGLILDRMLESGAPRSWEAESVGGDNVPVFLAIRCRKAA